MYDDPDRSDHATPKPYDVTIKWSDLLRRNFIADAATSCHVGRGGELFTILLPMERLEIIFLWGSIVLVWDCESCSFFGVIPKRSHVVWISVSARVVRRCSWVNVRLGKLLNIFIIASTINPSGRKMIFEQSCGFVRSCVVCILDKHAVDAN